MPYFRALPVRDEGQDQVMVRLVQPVDRTPRIQGQVWYDEPRYMPREVRVQRIDPAALDDWWGNTGREAVRASLPRREVVPVRVVMPDEWR